MDMFSDSTDSSFDSNVHQTQDHEVFARYPDDGGKVNHNGSYYVSGKLPTYPSPKLTLKLTIHLG